MKLNTLIRDTQCTAGTAPSAPSIAVLLAVSACSEATLARAVDSVLEQTFSAFELIVADDSNEPRVAAWLDEVQARDNRVTVLRHPRAIGVAAVGWFEAFRQSRADWFVLAREEDAFQRDALQQLRAHANADAETIGFGFVETAAQDGATGELSTDVAENQSQSLIMLRVENFIARNAVLIPRHAIEAIGFLDPHVLLAHASEWDFWRRLSERFELKPIDVAVGTRYVQGGQNGALLVDRWAVEEWMRTDRGEQLKLERIGEYDVHAPNPSHGRSTRDACIASAEQNEPDDVIEAAPAGGDDGYLLVVCVQYDASAALYFDMLPLPYGRRVRIVPNEPDLYLEALGRASALIVLRAVRAYQPWLDAAQALGVPAYYFLDDNMPLLAECGEASMHGEDFSLSALRTSLKRFDGVLLSSLPLLEYFDRNGLHENLQHFPVACAFQDEERERAAFGARRQPDEIVFAFMGGLARSKMVWDLIVPALTRLTEEGAKIHFVAPGLRSDSEILDRLPKSMRVTLMPWDHGYAYVVRRFARFSPDYMLLASNETANNLYKTRHPLLTARLIDAVAVLPHIDPYLDIADGSCALIVDKPFELDAWYRVLKRIVDGHVDVEGVKTRNREYCAREFSGVVNARVLLDVMQHAGPSPSWQLQYRRLAALGAICQQGGAGRGGKQTELALRRNADELLGYRRNRRFSWRHRVMARPSDMWNHCSAAFWPLQSTSLKNGWKRRNSTLDFSDSLHDKPYYDYEVMLPAGALAGVAFAISTDGLKQGKMTVELVSPAGKLAARSTQQLNRVDLSKPVQFRFKTIHLAGGELWRVRLRCRSAVPVYIYELVNRRGFKMFYSPATPFMDLLAPLNPKDVTDLARVAGDVAKLNDEPTELVQSKPGSESLPIDLKLIIEGDIPTNHILERVIREALGNKGTVEKCLLSDFTPDVLLDGGTVILSRVGDPTAMPMLDWMAAHRIAYLYYIDDNFWELTGDTRLGQYYQSPNVRKTLERAIKDAKAVIVNSVLLGDYIKKRFPRANVIHLNAPFDFSLAERVAPHDKAPGEVRIGFAGNVSRAADFVEILPAFDRLLAEYSHASLMFFGYCPPELKGRERVTYVPTVKDYAEFIALKAASGLDIGIAPMTGSVSNLYKTNNKYREYGALKIAGIYTNTSPYMESVVDGKTGLLVEHRVDAWYGALKRLVMDGNLRGEIADAAYQDVRENYAQNVVAQHWADMLFDFAARYSTGNPIETPSRAIVMSIRARRVVNRTLLRAHIVSQRLQAAIARRIRARNE